MSTIITFPVVGVSIPPKTFNKVVLPAPLAPTITTTSPFSISNDTFFTACTSIFPDEYVLFRFFTSIKLIFLLSFLLFYTLVVKFYNFTYSLEIYHDLYFLAMEYIKKLK